MRNTTLINFRPGIFLFLLLISLISRSQSQDPKLNVNNPDMPEWVKLMYSENPNVWDVQDAYQSYYKTHAFEKNTYTQYYKRWMRGIKHVIDKEGFIRFPSPEEIVRMEATALEVKSKSTLFKGQATAWEFIGPNEIYNLRNDVSGQTQFPVAWHANVYGVDIAPSDPNILYAGTETGGLYKTTDKGLNWTLVNSSVLSIRGVRGVKIHPDDPDIVYFNASGKIYKTTDGGLNWAATGDADFQKKNLVVHDMAINPADPEIVYLATNNGLFRSTDGGVSWDAVITNQCWTVVIKADDPDMVFTATSYNSSSRFYKSTDKGASFTPKDSGWPEPLENAFIYGVRLTVTEADPGRIYALIGEEGITRNGFLGVFVSNDAGETWTHPHGKIGPPYDFNTHPNVMAHNGTDGFYQGFFDFAIIASPLDADKIIIGGTSWWRSNDGVKTYKPLGGYVGYLPWSHPDMQFLRAHGNELWIACDGGLTYSTDFGETHQARTKGIWGTEFWGLGAGWNEDILVGGRYHNGNAAWHENYPKGQFLRMGGAEAPTGYVSFGESRKAYFSDIGGRILPEQFNGYAKNFSVGKFPNESYVYSNSSEMIFDPRCWNIIYLGNENGIWKSDDGGMSFTLLKSFGGTAKDEVREIEIARSNPDVIYLIQAIDNSKSKLWKTSDGGMTWIEITSSPVSFTDRVCIAVNATDENDIWVASFWGDEGKQIWRTNNSGESWRNLSHTELNGFRITSIVQQYGTNGGLYIGTDLGTVFYRSTMMRTWEVVSSGLPVSAKTLKLIPFYKKGKLRNGTWNYGIWETDFYEQSTPLAQIAVDKLVSYSVQDTFYFDDHSVRTENGATWSWSFPEGNPSSSTLRNPKVTYDSPGEYTVTLTVSDVYGSSTQTIENLIIINNAAAAEETAGNALQLKSTADYAAAGSALYLNTDEATLMAWIKRNGAQNDFAGILFCRGGNTTAGISVTSANELRYHWNDAGWDVRTGHILPDNVWTHIALVVQPNKVMVYKNGDMFLDRSARGVEEFDTPILIGRDSNSETRTFKGLIDEVCIYNRALSQSEIRETMRLVKKPDTDPFLKSYYQFNENSGPVLDRAGTVNLSLANNADRIISTGPFGGGASSRKTVNSAGLFDFSGTGVQVEFPEGGTYPTGEVVVSRIDQLPNVPPDGEITGPAYWIIDNYGSNSSFTRLTEMSFSGLGTLTGPASNYNLYRREVFSEAAWGDSISIADEVSSDAGGIIVFNEGSTVTKFGQFVVSSRVSTSVSENTPIPAEFTLEQNFPNPFNPVATIRFSLPRASFVELAVYDDLGRKVNTILEKDMPAGIHLVNWRPDKEASGVYFYRIQAGNFTAAKKMILLR